jgi:hypothetical protein
VSDCHEVRARLSEVLEERDRAVTAALEARASLALLRERIEALCDDPEDEGGYPYVYLSDLRAALDGAP